jgi:hypothetical protein
MTVMPARETSRLEPRAGNVTALWLLVGPVVWALHFTILYGAHTLLCAVRGPDGGRAVMLVAVVATGAALAMLAVAMLGARSPRAEAGSSDRTAAAAFVRSATSWLIVLSAIAIVWAGAAALVVPACGPSH